jgi:hypothetical protein
MNIAAAAPNITIVIAHLRTDDRVSRDTRWVVISRTRDQSRSKHREETLNGVGFPRCGFLRHAGNFFSMN